MKNLSFEEKVFGHYTKNSEELLKSIEKMEIAFLRLKYLYCAVDLGDQRPKWKI